MNGSITKNGKTVEYGDTRKSLFTAIKKLNLNDEVTVDDADVVFSGYNRKIAIFGEFNPEPTQREFDEYMRLIQLNKTITKTKIDKEKDKKMETKIKPAVEKLKKDITDVFTMCRFTDIETLIAHLEMERKNNIERLRKEELDEIAKEENVVKEQLEKLALRRKNVLGVINVKVTAEPQGKRGGKDRCPEREQVMTAIESGLNTTKELASHFNVKPATFLTYRDRLNVPSKGERSEMQYLTDEQWAAYTKLMGETNAVESPTEPTEKPGSSSVESDEHPWKDDESDEKE